VTITVTDHHSNPNPSDEKHFIILFRIIYSNNIYNTLSFLPKLNKNDKNYYILYIMDILSLKSNNYKALLIIKIMINYGVREDLAIKKLEKSFEKKNIDVNTSIF